MIQRALVDVLDDPHLGGATARCLARVPACVRCHEIRAPTLPAATELVANAESIDQIVRALDGSAQPGGLETPRQCHSADS
jgi:hypothetical protein